MERPYQNFWGKVKYGSNCRFGAFVDIGDGVEFGDDCTVECFVSIPPGWKFGSGVFIGPGARFANDKHPKAKGEWEMRSGAVEDGVSIGINATILPVKLGKDCVIGAGAVVVKDCEPGKAYVGNPARELARTGETKLDVERVRELVGQLAKDGNRFADSKVTEESLRKAMSEGVLATRFDGGKLIGMGWYFSRHTLLKYQAVVEDVVVDEAYRGRGLGVEIMEELIEKARKQGIEVVELSSNPSRIAANKLYQKLGFELHPTNHYILRL